MEVDGFGERLDQFKAPAMVQRRNPLPRGGDLGWVDLRHHDGRLGATLGHNATPRIDDQGMPESLAAVFMPADAAECRPFLDRYLPAWAMIPIAIATAALFGAAWAAVPAWLQAWRGSHIVITTIMFNFVAAALMVYLMVNVLIAPGSMTPQSRNFEPSSFLPAMHGTALNLSLVLSLACTL